jgi:hypothetical protein
MGKEYSAVRLKTGAKEFKEQPNRGRAEFFALPLVSP